MKVDMPNYRGHLFGGLITYAIIMALLVSCRPSLVTAFEWLLCTLAGALFPDVDVKSRGQKYFYYVVFLLFLFLIYQKQLQLLSCISCITVTPMLSKHRGIFHNQWFLIIMPLVVWAMISVIFSAIQRPLLINILFFIAGSLSHIYLDRCVSRLRRVL